MAAMPPSPGQLHSDHHVRKISIPFACLFSQVQPNPIFTEMCLSQQSCTLKIWVHKGTKGLNKLLKQLKEAQCVWNVASEWANGGTGEERQLGRWAETRPPGALQTVLRVWVLVQNAMGSRRGDRALQLQTSWVFSSFFHLLQGEPM